MLSISMSDSVPPPITSLLKPGNRWLWHTEERKAGLTAQSGVPNQQAGNQVCNPGWEVTGSTAQDSKDSRAQDPDLQGVYFLLQGR